MRRINKHVYNVPGNRRVQQHGSHPSQALSVQGEKHKVGSTGADRRVVFQGFRRQHVLLPAGGNSPHLQDTLGLSIYSLLALCCSTTLLLYQTETVKFPKKPNKCFLIINYLFNLFTCYRSSQIFYFLLSQFCLLVYFEFSYFIQVLRVLVSRTFIGVLLHKHDYYTTCL